MDELEIAVACDGSSFCFRFPCCRYMAEKHWSGSALGRAHYLRWGYHARAHHPATLRGSVKLLESIFFWGMRMGFFDSVGITSLEEVDFKSKKPGSLKNVRQSLERQLIDQLYRGGLLRYKEIKGADGKVARLRLMGLK